MVKVVVKVTDHDGCGDGENNGGGGAGGGFDDGDDGE